MNIRPYPFYLLLACALVVSLTACDQSSQNIEFGSGSNLTVDGPARLTLEGYQSGPGIAADTVTGEYTVFAYTVEQDYSWSLTNLSGRDDLGPDGPDYTRRDQGNEGNPEVAGEESMNPRTYQVQVSTTVDGEDYTGSAATKVDYANASSQLTSSRNLSLARTLLTTAGLTSLLDSDAEDAPPNRWTAFLPTTSAITNALDNSGNGSLEADEIPAPGVLSKLFQYHIAADSLTQSEVSGQTPSTVLHPEETLSLTSSDASGTNTTGTYQLVDIPTSDGIVHSIDDILLPNALVSLQDQTVLAASGPDSVLVEGAYLHDGGFVVLHEEANDGSVGSIIGSSDYQSSGFQGNDAPIPVELNNSLSDSTGVYAMPHRDDGDQTFQSGSDNPYTRGSSSVPVTDKAGVDVP